jgi:hypothetical protein
MKALETTRPVRGAHPFVSSLGLGLLVAGCVIEAVSDAPEGGEGVGPPSSVDAGQRGPDAQPGAELPAAEAQFFWPVAAWISATDEYANGTPHSGSADLSAQLYSPVYPARHGVVEAVSFSLRGGHGVRLRHEGDDGDVYTTLYTHLAEAPRVAEGDEVTIDTQLGYVGRVGNANLGGPHVHFTLARVNEDGQRERVIIPAIDIGEWVDRGDPIPGDYEGLSLMPRPDASFDVEVIDDGLGVYETTRRAEGERLVDLAAGEVVTVVGSDRGQYLVEAGEHRGYVPHSGTQPAESPVFDVVIAAAQSANVRSEPDSAGDNVIGSIAPGLHLTGYELGGATGDWVRVLWPCNATSNRSTDDGDRARDIGGCPGVANLTLFKYGWMGPVVTERDEVFEARTRVADLDVFANRVIDGRNEPACPCTAETTIGELEGIRRPLTVLDTHDGWYQIDFGGELAWVRGWFTAGRQ